MEIIQKYLKIIKIHKKKIILKINNMKNYVKYKRERKKFNYK